MAMVGFFTWEHVSVDAGDANSLGGCVRRCHVGIYCATLDAFVSDGRSCLRTHECLTEPQAWVYPRGITFLIP